jgi:hypothetical protein
MSGGRWDGPPIDAWDAWTPREAAAILVGCDASWCVAAGWAIDLFLGRQTRDHHDLEISTPRVAFDLIHGQLGEYVVHATGGGEAIALRPDESTPVHKHQNWVLEPRVNAWRMDIMLEPGDADTWVFRRDETIRAPRSSVVGVRNGVPFLAPQVALLYKAKNHRPKDDHDFDNVVPHLDPLARAWLHDNLARVHPGHAWIASLAL